MLNRPRPARTLCMSRIARPLSSSPRPWTTSGMLSPRPGARATGSMTFCRYLRERASTLNATQVPVLLWLNKPKGVQLVGRMEQLTASIVPRARSSAWRRRGARLQPRGFINREYTPHRVLGLQNATARQQAAGPECPPQSSPSRRSPRHERADDACT